MTQNRSTVPDKKASAPLVHTDLAAPFNSVAKDGFKYSLSFVSDHSGVIFVYFLKQKSDTLAATEQFLSDTASIGKVMCIRSDNGGKFVGQKYKSFLRQNKIKHEPCAPHSPHIKMEEPRELGLVYLTWQGVFCYL